eukprot:2779975-Rhodomonas_salina.1
MSRIFYALFGTGMAYLSPHTCPVLTESLSHPLCHMQYWHSMSCARYAMSGTEIAYGAARIIVAIPSRHASAQRALSGPIRA